ncbi:MAG TPA: hypothetical protein VK611_08735 [Acidimicrobiales bacterium]|nr:hypothetical protein [Acidimicrobiales bacterium]
MTATVLGGALSLVVSACSGDDNDAEQQPRTTTTEADPTTTTLNPEEAARNEVITAREAAADAWADALAAPAPNPDLPELVETFTGLMFDRLVETASGMERTGVAQRYPDDSQRRIEVESIRFEVVDGQEVAFLEVCTVEDSERIVVATGEVLDSGVRTYRAAEAMRKVDGVWKLAERRQDSREEGVTGCAVD